MQTINSTQCPLPPDMLERLHDGETLALEGDGSVVAFIVPAYPSGERRPFGLCSGDFSVPDDFNDPSPELEALFYGSDFNR
jgi:antitoxin (DNA-binding transcriptional repressor) of toxin-antitoxin stability system